MAPAQVERRSSREQRPQVEQRRGNSGRSGESPSRADRRSGQSRGGDSRSYRDSRSGRDSRSYRDSRSGRDSRSYGSRSGGYGSNHSGQRYSHRGRVSRVHPWNGGYRVWVGGSPYPFFVPLAYWNHNRFRVGLDIAIGGYYNPLGYYDYYDGYRDGYYSSRNDGYRGSSEADFAGVVESVDYRRDSFVIRNEETGNFITVVLRDRREGQVRPGDYVTVRGDWTNSGYFRAYDVEWLDDQDRY